jgi:hypothetical protein
MTYIATLQKILGSYKIHFTAIDPIGAIVFPVIRIFRIRSLLCFRSTSQPHRWCLHLIVVVGLECSRDPESYAGGRVATGRATHAGQVKG